MDKIKVSIYMKVKTKGNPRGPGKAAAIMEYIDPSGVSHIREGSVTTEHATKNALTLKICLHSIRRIIKPCQITIYTDSAYLSNMEQLKKWEADGWKRANGRSIANQEEWKQLSMSSQIHRIQFKAYNKKWETELENLLKEE